MKLTYSGKTKEFTHDLEKKIIAQLAKMSKFAEQRGEREVHLTHQVERHLHKVEIGMNFYDHALIGEGADGDLPTAIHHAIQKLEKQLLKVRAKWRDTHRDPKGTRSSKESWDEAPPAKVAAEAKKPAKKTPGSAGKPKIFRVNYDDRQKPMTPQEAAMQIGKDVNYLVYRDSDRDCLSVLLRRSDGNFDLIES